MAIGTTEARERVIAANDAYLEGRLTRAQRNAALRGIAALAGYDANDLGATALITDLLEPR